MESAGRERGRGRQRKNIEQESRQKRNQDRHKATKIKNKKCVMQDRDGQSRACAAKMTSDSKCHRGRGRKSNQASGMKRLDRQGQTHLQASRFLEVGAASAFSGDQ